MTKLGAIILASMLSFAGCAPSHRAASHAAPAPPSESQPTTTVVDGQFYLERIGGQKTCNGLELSQVLILDVQIRIDDPATVDLITKFSTIALPTFEKVRRDGVTGAVQAEWKNVNSVFSYHQEVVGVVQPDHVELTYTLGNKQDTTSYTCETVVRGFPRSLQDPTMIDGIYTTNYYSYGRTEKPSLQCHGDRWPPRVSQVYRLDIYYPPGRPPCLAFDHGEVTLCLDREPIPNTKMVWNVPASRNYFWGNDKYGIALVDGVIQPDRVDLLVKFVVPPSPLFGTSDQCWYEYRIEGAKRLFFAGEADNLYRVETKMWDQCNTWPTGAPARVTYEEELDIVVNADHDELKILNRFGILNNFPLFSGNTFSKTETAVTEDGDKITWLYNGAFTPPFFWETVEGVYPNGCLTHTETSGRARFSH